jgi:hypothetical protein
MSGMKGAGTARPKVNSPTSKSTGLERGRFLPTKIR